VLTNNVTLDQQFDPTLMPLTFAQPGQSVRLVEVRAGNRLRKRLADLGLHNGMIIRVVSSNRDGALILAVTADSRLALGQGMAQKIMVRPVEEAR
jgi:Fe2+ transport system protein FeoA